MRVLGRTQSGYMLESSSDEIANIIGKAYLQRDEITYGTVIEVSGMYKLVYALREMPEKIAAMQKYLNQASNFMNLDSVIDGMIQKAKEKSK